MKIAIIGNYGATNVGDEAILKCLLTTLAGHHVTVFSAQPESIKSTKKVKSAPLFPLGIRSFFRYRFKPSKKALKSVDVAIVGGGGLFQDDRLYACFLWAWQVFWLKRFKKSYFIHATGVGPLKTRWGKHLTRWAYLGAKAITVRDEASKELLSELGIKKEVHVTADPVFSYFEKEASHPARESGLYLISVRPWLNRTGDIIKAFESFLLDLKKKKQVKFQFVCMQQVKEDDLRLIKPLIERVGGFLLIPKDFEDLMGQLEKAEFAIGMRYHFMIAAILTKTPLIPVSYSPKTRALFQDSPMASHLIPVGELTSDRLKKALKELSVSYNNVMVYEKAIATHLCERVQEGEARLKEFIALNESNDKKNKTMLSVSDSI